MRFVNARTCTKFEFSSLNTEFNSPHHLFTRISPEMTDKELKKLNFKLNLVANALNKNMSSHFVQKHMDQVESLIFTLSTEVPDLTNETNRYLELQDLHDKRREAASKPEELMDLLGIVPKAENEEACADMVKSLSQSVYGGSDNSTIVSMATEIEVNPTAVTEVLTCEDVAYLHNDQSIFLVLKKNRAMEPNNGIVSGLFSVASFDFHVSQWSSFYRNGRSQFDAIINDDQIEASKMINSISVEIYNELSSVFPFELPAEIVSKVAAFFVGRFCYSLHARYMAQSNCSCNHNIICPTHTKSPKKRKLDIIVS